MKAFVSAALFVLAGTLIGAAGAQVPTARDPQVSHPVSIGKPVELALQRAGSTSIDLRTLPPGKVRKRERPEREPPPNTPVELPGSIAAALAPSFPGPSAPAPTPSASYPGLDFSNWGAGHPPDTNGDVGPGYFIETVNTSIGIYDKATGTRVAAFTFDTFMSQGSFGNLCDTDNFGDPVVLYDTFEDRWMISDFAFQLDGSGNVVYPPGAFQCIAVSKSGDPVAGGWNFYSINTTGGLGDYPKFGVWPDGIYMSVNMFDYAATGSYQNARLYAFNKAQMYAGAASVQVVAFDAPAAEFTLLPANARLQTGTPPANSPNYFAVVWQFLNGVSIYKFHVDWNSVSASTLTGPFTSLTASNWSQLTSSTVPEPGGSLDTLYPRLMVQNQYTKLGGVESLWDSHTVGASGTSSSQAAVRYYQVKVTGGTIEANATQAFTYAPDTSVHRFMPSVGIDRAGNMAIGYSATNNTLDPAIRYAGRLAGDAANAITQTETSLIEGTGAQTLTSRWGDYSSMSLDPADGCTFWMASEYYAATGTNWQTRIGAFKYPAASCATVSTGSLQGTVTATAGGAPIAGASVALGSRTTTTNGSGFYAFNGIAAGTYPALSAAAAGYTTGTAANIVVASGSTTTQDFSLAAAPASACLTDTSQADFELGTPTNVDLTTSAGNVTLEENVSVDQHADDNGFASGYGFSSTALIGQTFTAGVTGKLTQVDAYIFCASCSGTNPNLVLELRATSSGLPVMTAGGLIASSTIAGTSSGAGGTFSFPYATQPTLTAGAQYGIVIRLAADRTAGTQAWLSSSGDVYAGGRRVTCTSSSCATPKGSNSNSDLIFSTWMDSGYSTSGDLVSSTKDANPASGFSAAWTTLTYNATVPANTSVLFQAAGSNSIYGPFSFVGPDGTAATYFANGDSLGGFFGKRYLQYRAYLATSNTAATPTLADATVCFANSSGTAADLSIANSDGVTTATPGGSVAYTITAANAGPGAASGAIVTDTFPAALTCTWSCSGSNGGTCTASGAGNINDSVGLPSGGSVTYSASCSIAASATGSLANTASVAAPGGVTDPNSANNSKTDTDTLTPQANLSITKSDGVTTATPGGSVTYTITAANAGPSNAPGSTVADTFPAALTCTWTCSGSNGGTCTVSGSGNINDSVDLPNGGSVQYSASCTIAASATGSLANTATVSAAGGITDPASGNNSATDTDTLSPQADLSITKTDGVTTATPGGSVAYTITAANAGPSNAPGSTITDTFPAALTCTWTCSGSNGGTCTASGSGNINNAVNLPVGGSVSYAASCNISAAATGSLANSATIAAPGGVSDTNSANNSATDTDTLSPQADLSITKTDGVTTAAPGGSVAYTITAANAGPSNATNATVADAFPAALTCTWTCSGSNGGTCTASGSGNINDSANLPSGGSVTYGASCSISASATGSLANIATVAAPGGVTDTNSANNNASDTDTLVPQADLAITNSDGVASATPGGSVTYAITASNAGPSNTSAASVTDTFPAALTCTWSCSGSNGGTCTASGAGNINDSVGLPSGGSVTYSASCSIAASATGSLANTASVAAPGGVTDPNSANNSKTDTDTLTPQANLSITKSDGVTTATPGGSVSYTITAANAGPSNAPGSTVADTFPAALTCTWTCSGSNGGTCTVSGSGNINDSVDLPNGGSVQYSASCTIAASATGSLANTATVSAAGGITDPASGNNSATDTDTLAPQADLSITKTDGVTTATPGGSVTYTITAANAGPSNAPNSTVADTFPAALTCTWTCSGSNGGTCTASGSGNINNAVNLPVGGSVTYSASCNISAAATGSLANSATIAAPGGVSDSNAANNSATDTDTLSPQADLSITKTDGVTTATPGASVTYTITAANAGPSNAPSSTVADSLPAALICTWTCSGSNGGTCTASGSGDISDSASLPSGGSVTYAANCDISAAATGSLSNTATLTAPAGISDGNPADNTATDTDALSAQADLSITNSDGVASATAGASVTYTITAANAGPSAASGASVTDAFPASLTCSWTCSGANGGTCTASGSGAINDSADLPDGGSVTYSASCSISPSATGSLVNTASVAAPGSVADLVPANNGKTDTDTLNVQADVAVTMSDNRDYVQVGDVLDYVIEVTNPSGPSTAVADVSDALPPELAGGTWVCTGSGSATCNPGSGDTLADTATVPVGGKAAYVYSATVQSAGSADSLGNTASATLTAGSDPAPANNSASDTDVVVIFRDGFEGAAASLARINPGDSRQVTAQLRVDAGLLDGLGIVPVAIASGRSADGRQLFTLQIARFGGDIALRAVTTGAWGGSEISPWQSVPLDRHLLEFAWQSASPGADDGYFAVAAGGLPVLVDARAAQDRLSVLVIAVQHDVPWLVLLGR